MGVAPLTQGRGAMREQRIAGAHVRVEYHNRWTRRTPDETVRECERIAREIVRHVDDAHVEVCVEIEEVCTSCGRPWTEKDPTYNGGCCDEDMKGDPAA
jgi:hypothetical protein